LIKLSNSSNESTYVRSLERVSTHMESVGWAGLHGIKADALDALMLLKANAEHIDSLSNYVFRHNIYSLFYSTLLKF